MTNSSSPSAIPARSKPRNLAHAVIEHISSQITEQRLLAGEKLPTESEIMRIYDVSRTVVREAISHLKAAGLVETRHGIGTFVLPPSSHGIGLHNATIVTVRDVLDVLEVRISLETEAAWLAASRRSEAQVQDMAKLLVIMQDNIDDSGAQASASVDADVQFHLLIAQATCNPYFVELLSHLGNTIIPRARLNTAQLEQDKPSLYLGRVHREHENIYQAIQRKDAEAARAAMRTHLSNSRERLRRAQEMLESR